VLLVIKASKARLGQLVSLAHEDQTDHAVPPERLAQKARKVRLDQVAVLEHLEILELMEQ